MIKNPKKPKQVTEICGPNQAQEGLDQATIATLEESRANFINAAQHQVFEELKRFEKLPEEVSREIQEVFDDLQQLHNNNQLVGILGSVLTTTGVKRFSFTTQAAGIVLLTATADALGKGTHVNAKDQDQD